MYFIRNYLQNLPEILTILFMLNPGIFGQNEFQGRSIGTTITNLLYWGMSTGTPASSDPSGSRYKPEKMIALEKMVNPYYMHSGAYPGSYYYGNNFYNQRGDDHNNYFTSHVHHFYDDISPNDLWNGNGKPQTPLIAQPLITSTPTNPSSKKGLMSKFNSYMKKVFKQGRRRLSGSKNQRIESNWMDGEYDGGKRHFSY